MCLFFVCSVLVRDLKPAGLLAGEAWAASYQRKGRFGWGNSADWAKRGLLQDLLIFSLCMVGIYLCGVKHQRGNLANAQQGLGMMLGLDSGEENQDTPVCCHHL